MAKVPIFHMKKHIREGQSEMSENGCYHNPPGELDGGMIPVVGNHLLEHDRNLVCVV